MSRLGGKDRGNVGTAWCQAEILHPSCCVPLGESFNHSYPWPPLLENGGESGFVQGVGTWDSLTWRLVHGRCSEVRLLEKLPV